MFAQVGLQGDFLKLKETRALFRREQHFPPALLTVVRAPETAMTTSWLALDLV